MQSFPGIFHYTIIGLRDIIQTEDLQFDRLATIPTTSKVIFTSALVYEMFQLPIYIRKETKSTELIV